MRNSAKILGAVLAAASVVAFAAGCSAKAKADRSLERADRYFKSGDYQKAEVEYLNVFQLNSTNSHAIAHLGTIYYEQGRIGRSFAFLTRASELNSNDVEARIKLATINVSAGKPREAREQALFALDKEPRHAEAPILLAETATPGKDAQQVRQRLEKISAQIGETAPVQLGFVILSLREKDLKSAEAAVQRALALDPKSGAAHQALGSISVMKNDLKAAEAAFKTASELSPLRSPWRLAYADFKIKTGAVEEGKRLLAVMTKETPDYLPAWNRQAGIALAEKKYDDCASFIRQILSRDSSNLDALVLQARLSLARNEPEKAIQDLERTSRQYKDQSPDVHYYLALAYLQNNDSTKALKSVNQAIALNTNLLDAVLLSARLNIANGNPGAAIPPLSRIVKQQPLMVQAHLSLADAYLTQKKPDEALAVLAHMMTIFPKNPEVPFIMGNTLLGQKKLAEARKAFEKSHELSPVYLPALERLVDLDLADKQYDAANQRVKTHMEKYPADAASWLLVAKIHLAQKQTKEAETALLKVIEIDPDQRNSYLLLAQLYVTSNRQQEALDKLNGLVAKKTNDVAAFMQIGMINDAMKNYKVARDAYEKLLSINPNFSGALNNLAYIYSEHLIDLDKAYKAANRARQLLPNDPFSADTLGWILYKRGDYSRALGLITESAQKFWAEPEIQFHLGMTYYMLGQREPARLALQKGLESKKEFPGQDEGKKRLAILAIDSETGNADARKELEKMLRSEPNDPIVLSSLAAIYGRNGETDKAMKSYQAVLDKNPKNLPAMVGLIRLYTGSLNETQKALELAKKAHILDPDDADISQILGQLVTKSGDYKWALTLFQDASRQSKQPELGYDLAWANYHVGRVAEAETKMQQVVADGKTFSKIEDAKRFLMLIAAAKNPAQSQTAFAEAQQMLKTNATYVPALMVSAASQEQQGKLDEAKRVYERVLVANPLFSPATRSWVLLSAKTGGDDQKAYDLAAKARTEYLQDPAVAKAFGIIAYRKGDFARSVQLLKESSLKFKDDPELNYYLGMAHYRLKQPKESKAALQRALALNVSGKPGEEARRILLELK